MGHDGRRPCASRSKLNEIPYEISEGEGAFYGPKIDLHMDDALGRKWQMGTIQLDSQMPSRFGLKYVGPDNAEHDLYVVHRALYGSFERFLGILIEHFGGRVPRSGSRPSRSGSSRWARITARRPARLAEKLSDFRVEVDDSDETVGKRIRNAEVEKIPYTDRLRRPRVGRRARRP